MCNSSQNLLSDGKLLIVSALDFAEACFSTPAIRALSLLENIENIVILSPSSLLEYWKLIDVVDEVIVYDESLKSRKIVNLLSIQLREFHISLLWEINESAKALAKIGIKARIGPSIKELDKILTDKLETSFEPSIIKHRVHYYLSIADELGADVYRKENFKTLGFSANSKRLRIAIAEKSEYGAAYSWSAEVLENLKKQFEEKSPEVEWIPIPNKGNIVETLNTCNALLACEGEVAHWAACLGLPAVVIFGAGEPRWKRPLGKQSLVVREHVACSPCFLENCLFAHECQKSLNIALIISELENSINKKT